MKIIILILSLLSTTAFAETVTLTIEGMHCKGCKESITEKVCDNAVAKTKYESCTVEVVDKKTRKGQLVIVTKKDVKVDIPAIKSGIDDVGSDYKVTQEIVK